MLLASHAPTPIPLTLNMANKQSLKKKSSPPIFTGSIIHKSQKVEATLMCNQLTTEKQNVD